MNILYKFKSDSQYIDELEKLVAKLEVSKEAAEVANRAKSTFLSNSMHEFRTSLHVIIGFSNLLLRSKQLDMEDHRHLEIIKRSGNHLLTLINEVLELSKIEAGHTKVIESDTSLIEIVEETGDMLREKAEQTGLYLAIKTDGLPNTIRVDAVKLRQILINLLGNAVKFTRHGGVTLEVAAAKMAPRDGQSFVRLNFAVSDTGIGIAPEDQPKIFEPFVQMATHATQAGTGLGLTITRQHIQMLGGEIRLESTLGHGSTFSFSLEVPVIATT